MTPRREIVTGDEWHRRTRRLDDLAADRLRRNLPVIMAKKACKTADIARWLGVSRQRVQAMIATPNRGVVEDLAAALGVPESTLLASELVIVGRRLS